MTGDAYHITAPGPRTATAPCASCATALEDAGRRARRRRLHQRPRHLDASSTTSWRRSPSRRVFGDHARASWPSARPSP
ncbi:MAG: hypothetical protein MZU95_12905 [Desulfomicrobium escambiense]|nr:hypothetical protein [Desulfomicrobium escambiense]